MKELKQRKLRLTRKALKVKKIPIVIDETGDRKKGEKTDYVARQYLGRVGKIDNGIVSLNAYGVYKDITFPLAFKIFKPEKNLKLGDIYKIKIKLASEIITELVDLGFKIDLLLANSLYCESSLFIRTLDKLKLPWVLAIRSNDVVWMPSNQQVKANRWCKFNRRFSNGELENRYVRENFFGHRSTKTYWEITTDPETMPETSTSFVMTNLTDNRREVKKTLGNLYGLRTWVEYGFRQCKHEFGWTDYQFTNFKDIERWWQIIFCVYLMISLNSQVIELPNSVEPRDAENKNPASNFSKHQPSPAGMEKRSK